MGSAGSVATFNRSPALPDAFKETDIYRFYNEREIRNLGLFYSRVLNSGKDVPEAYKVHFLDLNSSFQSFEDFLVGAHEKYQEARQSESLNTLAYKACIALETHSKRFNDFFVEFEGGRLSETEMNSALRESDIQSSCVASIELFKCNLKPYIRERHQGRNRPQILYIVGVISCFIESHTEYYAHEGAPAVLHESSATSKRMHNIPWSPTVLYLDSQCASVFTSGKSITRKQAEEDFFYLDQTCCEMFRLRCDIQQLNSKIITYLIENDILLSPTNAEGLLALGRRHTDMHNLLRAYAWYRSFVILFYHPFKVMFDNEADIFIDLIEFLIPMRSCNYSTVNGRRSDEHRKKYLSNVKRKKRRKEKFKKDALLKVKHNMHWKHHVRLEHQKKQEDFLNQPLPGKSQYTLLKNVLPRSKIDTHKSTPTSMRELNEEDLNELRIQNKERLEFAKLPGSKSVELLMAQQTKRE